MFALTDADMNDRILGVADGPASFNAEATAAGYDVISADPLYDFTASQIEKRIEATYDMVVEQTRANADQFIWHDYKDADAVGQARLTAMKRFLQDYPHGKNDGRYIAASLPDLPFADAEFDLALCSHFLFLYSEQFGLTVHINAVRELARVAKEVRIFPLHNLANQRSVHLEHIIREMVSTGYRVKTRPVNYEFQRGARRMLVITRSA